MPDATAGAGTDAASLTEAIAYCTRRRAFMIIDAPETMATFAQAQTWIGGAGAPLRSRNAALYFPRLREPDPLMNGVVRTFPAAGALAGLYARTDAERGVWKAPAGTSANHRRRDRTAPTRSPTTRTARSIRSASTACAPSRSSAP